MRAAYDAVAAAYATEVADELADRPFARWLLERIADLAGPHPIVDVGCGPGHVATHLAAAGADVTGLDLSPAMIAQGRERYPDVSFRAGDLRDLMRPASAPRWGAVFAWYALIHLAPSELPTVVAALARVVRRRMGRDRRTHRIAGAASRRIPRRHEYLGAQVDLDTVLHDPTHVHAAVTITGLRAAEYCLGGPVAGETATECLEVLAQRSQ
ncbi:MAG: SAM-dependent methyltransferase [Actinomycetales bacterium]|nr:MAG: SAM-dependent methyltransferase [Actinomycetales bacterium]